MLTFSFARLFKAKGIDKPFTFLTKAGFSDSFATKAKNDKVKKIGLVQLEKLCIAFHCTPNDLFEYHPDGNFHAEENHPLQKIRKSEKVIDMRNALQSFPLDEIEEIEAFMNEKRKARRGKAE